MKKFRRIRRHKGNREQEEQNQRDPFFNNHSEAQPDGKASFFQPASVQTKLKVGDPKDEKEKEAETTADKVTKGDASKEKMPEKKEEKDKVRKQGEEEEEVQMKQEEEEETVQRQEKQEEEEEVQMQEEEEEIQAQSESSPSSATTTSTIESGINKKKNNGHKLPDGVQAEMESAFGSDFSQVNIHNDEKSAQLNKALKAKAFTHGKDIFFNKGEYAPNSVRGKHLLAHELTHVVQQTGQHKDKEINRKPLLNEEEMVSVQIISGTGNRHHETVHGGSSMTLQGRTDADYDGGVFQTENVTATRGEGCQTCEDCLHIRGTLVSTFTVTTTVTLPSINDYPNLTACQRQRVQNAIDTVLAPHEQQHVQAFRAYNGTVRTPFDFTICRSEFESRIQDMHNQIESGRRSVAQGASDALDPFNFTVDLNCD